MTRKRVPQARWSHPTFALEYPMRPCGECQLCCKLFPVPVLEKPAGAWCRHSCAAGCAIHASRPEVCRQYDCYWRDHDDLPDNCRPDRIGVVVTEAGNVSVGKKGDSPHLPERPAGCCAQMGTVPFFRPRGDLPGRFRRCRAGRRPPGFSRTSCGGDSPRS